MRNKSSTKSGRPREVWIRLVYTPEQENLLLQFLTFDGFNGRMQISGSDIHLLTVFDCVVRNNGFSAAQPELGLSQPTISNHITALEERLGVKLCQRGRRGFLLTDKGHIVHEVAQSLMGALEEQSGLLSALKGSFIGRLSVAVVDSSATDTNLRLPEAIKAMAIQAPHVSLNIEIKQPQDILSGIAAGTYQIGIGSFDNKISGLRYEDLYTESHSLYCGSTHSILPDVGIRDISETIYEYPWVHRGYWNRQRQRQIRSHEHDRVVGDIEAQIIMVLSGQYLGLLPDHAAQVHISSGRLTSLPPASDNFSCPMQLVTRNSPQPKIVELFRELVKSQYEL
ncbi:LysR family transcriptional regulator [Rhodobacteraceae bacterium B1Z28]|uniref:LysR family transcriptional regulator n=1 Tax=Ruegeria haliotis TaxID=2747601 RepID=A0ABX2PTC1_9RHOB|nr:LysR family transcriptional regulator [Ruegeria haliotis]NVO57417.1 LysR family transcriptional regulator [Ruegeria haliotis]